MNDLISRQAAIDAVVDAMMSGADADMVEGLIYMLPSAEPKWIPVTERLPMINTLALITTSKGIVVQVMYFGENMNGHKVWRSFGGEYVYWDEEVVAWMSLPEPWKGEADAKV